MDGRTNSFGYWLRRRRKALDLTQEDLAKSVACSRFAIRKIEADERRPSRHLAERLAERLAIPAQERGAFLEAARALRTVDRLVDNAPVAERRDADRAEAHRFVGRGKEYGAVTGLISGLSPGAGHVVLIEGEPGIGKSRLMREIARYARTRGLWTLAANCYEIERAMPYQPVIDLATQALDLAGDTTLQKLPSVSIAEIAALVPAVARRTAVPVLSADFPEARQARLFRAIVQLFEALATGRHLVVTIDDIQWADDASAQFLHYFARQAASSSSLVLCAYRDEELGRHERLAELVASLRREPHTRHMPLARLQLADTKELLETTGEAELAARLQRETDGNPFFLTTMLQALREGEISSDGSGNLPLPEALRASVRARLAHVPAAARPTLDLAAVLGSRFDFESLLGVTKEPEDVLLRALETLVSRRLLREEADGSFDFSHDKVREVVYREIVGARRTSLHRTVAETLERTAEGEPRERHARLAEHFQRGHVWDKAVRHMVLAAELSQKLFAMPDALHWLDRAVELAEAHPSAMPDHGLVDLHERRGNARAQAGQTGGAVADIRVVVDAARASGDRARMRDALIKLGMTYRRADDYGQATACLAQALEECRAMQDERQTADTLYHLGTVAWSNCRNTDAIAYHGEAIEICDRLGLTDLVAVQAYHGRGEAHINNLEPVAAIACFNRSIELARAIGDKSYESENLMMIGYCYTGYQGLGDYPKARANLEAALEIAQRADLQWHMGPSLLGLDHVRACVGNYGEAWTGMTRTLRWLESLQQTRYQLIAYDLLANVLLDVGLDAQAVEYSERALALSRATKITFWCPRIEANLAIAKLRLGDLGVGARIEAALQNARENSERTQVVRCLCGLAELALRLGEPARCVTLAAELLALARACGSQELEALGRRWTGEALAALGERESALEQLALAVAGAEAIGRVRLAADANAALAAAGGGAAPADRAQTLAAQIAASLEGCELSQAHRGPQSPG